jgi:transcriptional regulator GlxA family with amidase domain
VYIKRTGTTILSSVHSVRVEAAKQLWTSTTLRIFEVAQAVGFADEEYFSKRFQALTGKTPGVWRKEAGNPATKV